LRDVSSRHDESVDAATTLAPLIDAFFPAGPPVRFTLWDGSEIAPVRPGPDAPTMRITSPMALRRIIWSPGELGLARAYVAGDLDLDGDLFDTLRLLERASAGHHLHPSSLVSAAAAAGRAGIVGGPPPPPPEEAHQRGRVHSLRRDSAAIHHHYDVGNDFYRLVLGPSMTYSCARFTDAGTTLEDAQAAKFDLVCRKLGLHERRGMRLLDVGCGWGSLAIHAAREYGAEVVGVTISDEQVSLCRARVEESGMADLVDIRLQDYRDLGEEQFDAISSVGMFEHVGSQRMAEYFERLNDLLVPKGRLLNHAISSVGGSRIGNRSFIGRYVFPDAELIDVGEVVLGMERAGFEVRDVESLREHYALTLRSWVANLEANWDEAVELVGAARARVWRLYMAASAVGFEDGGLSIHQTLGVVPDREGDSGMPRTRRDFV
jgi:cyclopropane-fatty-acyl-phospholipid synthase